MLSDKKSNWFAWTVTAGALAAGGAWYYYDHQLPNTPPQSASGEQAVPLSQAQPLNKTPDRPDNPSATPKPKPEKPTQKPLALQQKAENGNADAQYELGVMYRYGEEGMPQDNAEAVKWYRKAAEQGHADAQASLGLMYQYGTGVPRDNAEALKLYLKAAEQGHANGQVSLGLMYEFGNGVERDLAAAKLWYGKAAAQDDDKRAKKLANINLERLKLNAQ